MAANVATGTTVSDGVGAGKAFPPLDAGTFAPQLFWLALTFGLLYVLVKRLALPRVSEAIEGRRRHIAGDLKRAEELKTETQLALSRYEQAVAEARAKASAMAKDLQDKLAADAEGERSRQDALIAQRLAEAEQRIDQSKARAVASVREIAADAAAAVVTRLIGAEVSRDEVQQALVRRAAE
jgi:F-type H+-transporting ATPase subunit b